MHWREKELIEIIKIGGKLKTSDIIDQSRMCKVTALKYLNSLKDSGHITFERVGPTKLWHMNRKDSPRGGGGDSPLQFKNILRALREFEKSTGKKGFIIMSTEDLDSNPVGLQISLQDDGNPSFELKRTEAGW
jgi:hypothetical protein